MGSNLQLGNGDEDEDLLRANKDRQQTARNQESNQSGRRRPTLGHISCRKIIEAYTIKIEGDTRNNAHPLCVSLIV